VGGPASRAVTTATEAELLATVRELDSAGEPLLLVGGGSNLLVGDAGFDGTVVSVAMRGIDAEVSACAGATVTVAAGEDWDALVARSLAEEWSGLEALSGIPGLTGATPIQNVGAYGSDVSQTIASVRTLDRHTGQLKTFAAAECGFGYRNSRFKAEPGRHVVLTVTFQLALGTRSGPVRYPELARALDVAVGERSDTRAVREAVLAIRRRKGMVLDEADHDTWSAGSFFTNPLLPAARADALPDSAPRYPQPDGRVKTSAAWLIEQAGYGRGYGPGPARVSTKHSLALTNRGGATASDVLELARTIRSGVAERFGIDLEPEPVLVGCVL
jgi:UDP-N-acetylmuramate dehydrogenase